MIREFHLFAGIGGGIYGGMLLHHKCVGGVEINQYCQTGTTLPNCLAIGVILTNAICSRSSLSSW